MVRKARVASAGQHESGEEVGQGLVRVQRQQQGDVLVRSHHHQGAARPVHAAQVEDVGPVLQVGTENLVVVAQAVASLARPQQFGHRPEGQVG